MDAYRSYERALELLPDDEVLLEAMAKANRERLKDMRGVLQTLISECVKVCFILYSSRICCGILFFVQKIVYIAKLCNKVLLYGIIGIKTFHTVKITKILFVCVFALLVQ